MTAERGGKAIIAACIGVWFVIFAIIILSAIHPIATIIGVPIFIALLVAWVLQKPQNATTDSQLNNPESAKE